MNVDVYCDGSGNTFDSDGGYGWRIVIDGVVDREGKGYIAKATNNVAELQAAIVALTEVTNLLLVKGLQPSDVSITLVSDSQLVLGYASGRYQCRALHLTSLYIQLRDLYKALNAQGRWVKGHSGDEHNEACDKLAKAGRESKGLPN